jgi:predicted nucleic acid-binding protein
MALVVCLDTRFYFAHAQKQEQPWTNRIFDHAHLSGSRVISSTITITELLSVMGKDVGVETVRHRINSAKTAGVQFIPLLEEISVNAGELGLRNPEVPIADTIIAATALNMAGGKVYTDDTHFANIPGIRTFWHK